MSESTCTPAPKSEAVDHNKEARSILRYAERMDPPESPTRHFLSALVHSQLAVAEELKGIKDALEAGNLTYADGMVRNG